MVLLFIENSKIQAMVSVQMLYVEILLDAIGLTTGVLTLYKSKGNNLQKWWGILAISLSLLLLYDNIEWIYLFRKTHDIIPNFVTLPIRNLSLWHIIRVIIFFQIFSLYPIASLRPGWLSPTRIITLCIPAILIICIAICYEIFNGEITPLNSFSDISQYGTNTDVRMRRFLFIFSVIAPSCNFLFPIFKRWIPFRRRLAKGLYFYMICYAIIMIGYIWLMLGTSHASFNLFGYIVILPVIYLNYSYLRNENLLSLPPSPIEINNIDEIEDINSIEVSPVILELSHQLHNYIILNKPFTDPNYSLKNMLLDLQTNENRLNKALRYEGFSGFRDYVNFQRLQYFKEQARLDSNLTIKELMFCSGFTSRSSFYRYFASIEKMSPSEYLEQLKTNNQEDSNTI